MTSMVRSMGYWGRPLMVEADAPAAPRASSGAIDEEFFFLSLFKQVYETELEKTPDR